MKDKLYQIDNILMRLECYIHGKHGDDITKARINVMDLLKIIDTTANEAKVFSSNAVLAVTSDSKENNKESEVAVCRHEYEEIEITVTRLKCKKCEDIRC